MSHLLDTGTSISIIRNVLPAATRFAQASGGLHISVVTVTELELWLVRPRTPLQHTQGYFAFRTQVQFCEVTELIARRAARIGSALRIKGQRIGFADLLIAATALEQGYTLVTHDTQRFVHVPGLTVVDWLLP